MRDENIEECVNIEVFRIFGSANLTNNCLKNMKKLRILEIRRDFTFNQKLLQNIKYLQELKTNYVKNGNNLLPENIKINIFYCD